MNIGLIGFLSLLTENSGVTCMVRKKRVELLKPYLFQIGSSLSFQKCQIFLLLLVTLELSFQRSTLTPENKRNATHQSNDIGWSITVHFPCCFSHTNHISCFSCWMNISRWAWGQFSKPTKCYPTTRFIDLISM